MQKNKKVLGLIIASILAFIAVLVPISTSVRAEAGPVEIGYLMDEDFSFLYDKNPDDVLASGWDIRRAGGSISFGYNTWFKISDTNTTLPISMNKKFVSQSSGEITLEYRFKFASVMDGMKWALRSNEVEGVSIVSRNDTLYLETGGNNAIALQAYIAGIEYGVKVVADVSGNKTDVYINGVLKASAAGFKQPVTNLNNLHMNTGGTAVGDIYISPIKIYKGYVVNEKFISTMPGYLPGDWMANNVGGAIAVAEMRSSTLPDVHSLKMDATNATNSMSMEKSFTPQADNLIFEYKILIPQKTDGLDAELKSGNSSVIKLTTSNGKLSYINELGLPVEVYDYKANLWYHMKVKMNRVTSKADIYVNSKLQVQGADLSFGAAVDRIKFSTSAVNKGVMWLDDIRLNRDLPLPADYVPAPIQVSKASPDQPLVGAQTCNMWREGHHLGWDLINPYPERKPYLGFYDEGSAETADWEIKWMVEHGIDFQLSCWFRPQGSEGLPIKDPYSAFALHDGFFNAQYSNQMKFAIMWENGASRAKDSNDFRNNIVPFWLEYYFKDPRYLKIDNKPVISIYSLTGLKRDFGGTLAGVRSEIDYLRSAVQSAGFADIIVLSSYSGTDAQVMRDEKTAGIDAIYAYTRGALSGHAELQKSLLTQERDTGAIDVVSTISMGRDDTAWGTNLGYYATPDEFQSVAQWAKDTFIPSLPLNSLGQKMIMLDDWNEFGEGHFIMPAGLAGFGYVDAIRNVFTTSGGSHTDVQPTQAQKDRINTLYPSGRVVSNLIPMTPPPITNEYNKLWGFNTDGNNEGWSVLKQIDNPTVQGGTFTGTSSGTDPGMVSADNLGILAAETPYIKIRMKSSVITTGKIFFITDSDSVWDESKSVPIYVESINGEYSDYLVEMWKNKKWNGKIRSIRFDPVDTLGNFSIDYIGMVYSPIQGVKLFLDGVIPGFNTTPMLYNNSVMVPSLEFFKKIGAATEWDEASQTVIAVKDKSIIKVTVGSSILYKDNQTIALDQAPMLNNGVVMMPVSFLNQAFGYVVSWDQAAQISNIYKASITWNFNGAEGWSADSQISNILISNSVYNGTSTGTEPSLLSPDLLNIDASAIKRIRLKYKNSTSGNEARIYFTTNGDPVWNQLKMLSSSILPNDSDYREYIFDTSSFAAWNGVLKQLKIVPTNTIGNFSIDYVMLDITTSIPVKGNNLITDPGMETSTIRPGFEITPSLSTTEYHSGHQSLKVTKLNNYGSVQFVANIEKAKTYYYSAWAKLAPESTTGEVLRLGLSYKVDGISKQLILFTSAKLNATEWKQVQGTYIINETGNVTNTALFMYTDVPAAKDTFYIDDIELRPITYKADPAWVYVADISLNKSSTTLYKGDIEELTATVQPLNAINKDVVWSSDNPDVATVDFNGVVYARSVGTANITATTIESGKSSTSAVTVKTKVLASGVSLNVSAISIPLGLNETLIATVLPVDATNQAVIWSSDNTNVAIVDTSGNVYAKNVGTAFITATTKDGGFTARTKVTIPTNAALGTNLISDSGMEGSTFLYTGWETTRSMSTTVQHSGLQSLKVMKTNNYGSLYFAANIEKTKEYYYSAWAMLAPESTPGVVLRLALSYKVDGVSKQKIIFTSSKLNAVEWTQVQGTYTLNETGNVTNTSMFFYTDLPAAKDIYYLDDVVISKVLSYMVTGMSLNKDSTLLNKDQTETFAATVIPANATNKSVLWSTSDSSVATVDTNGVVTGVKSGTATLTVTTVDGGFQKSAIVVVDNTPPTITWEGVVDGLNYSDSVVPTVKAEDALSGLLSLTVNLDGRAWTLGTPITQKGAHTLIATAVDKLGNKTISTVNFTVYETTVLKVDHSLGIYSEVTSLRSVLAAANGQQPLAGETVYFKLDGVAIGTAVTDVSGVALLQYKVNVGASPDTLTLDHNLQAEFVQSDFAYYRGSTASGILTVSKEDATIAYTGGTTSTVGTAITLSALVTQQADGSLGNLSELPVQFEVSHVNPDGTLSPFSLTQGQSMLLTDVNGSVSVAVQFPAGLYRMKAKLIHNSYYTIAESTVDTAVYDTTAGEVKVDGWFPVDPMNEIMGITANKVHIKSLWGYDEKTLLPEGRMNIQATPGGLKLKLKTAQWLVISGDNAYVQGQTQDENGNPYTVRMMMGINAAEGKAGQILSLILWKGNNVQETPIFQALGQNFSGKIRFERDHQQIDTNKIAEYEVIEKD